MKHDRRRFLAFAAATPFAALLSARALADSTACFDPDSLPMSQLGLRKSLQFVAVSPDPAKRCGLCAFFRASDPGCGSCQILNGPVSVGSVCSSFAAKGKA